MQEFLTSWRLYSVDCLDCLGYGKILGKIMISPSLALLSLAMAKIVQK